MFKINMEFKRGIFFVRLSGEFTKGHVSEFENECLSIILKYGIKYIVINLDKLYIIDGKAIDSLINLSILVNRNKGRVAICGLSSIQVANEIHKVDYEANFYETNDELSALGVIRI